MRVVTASLLGRIISQREYSAWTSYAITIVIVAFFLAMKFALSDDLAGRGFLLLFPPVIISAAAFGRGQGLVAMVAGAGGAGWFWLDPTRSFQIDDPDDLLAAIIFLGICLFLISALGALRDALREIAMASNQRKLILREISHRLRNDFQTINTMLMLARRRGAEGIDDAMHRIRVLAGVYKKLEYSEEGSSVQADDFADGLVADLQAALIGERPIMVMTDIEPVTLSLQQATVIGLAINELLTNSMKYAFPDGRAGRVVVRFRRESGGVLLAVEDNGIGFSPDSAPQGTGLGRSLIEQMVAQSGGTITTDGANGVRTVIRMPL